MGFITWIVVGLIAGWLAGQVMKGGGYGRARGHHSRNPRRRCGWLGLWTLGNLAGRRHDRFDHSGICWRGNFGWDYALAEKSLNKTFDKKRIAGWLATPNTASAGGHYGRRCPAPSSAR